MKPGDLDKLYQRLQILVRHHASEDSLYADDNFDKKTECERFLRLAGVPTTFENMRLLWLSAQEKASMQNFLSRCQQRLPLSTLANEVSFRLAIHAKKLKGPQQLDEEIVAQLCGTHHVYTYALASAWRTGELSFKGLKFGITEFHNFIEPLTRGFFENDTLLWRPMIEGRSTLQTVHQNVGLLLRQFGPMVSYSKPWKRALAGLESAPKQRLPDGHELIWGHLSRLTQVVPEMHELDDGDPGLRWYARELALWKSAMIHQEPLETIFERLKVYVKCESEYEDAAEGPDWLDGAREEQEGCWAAIWERLDLPGHSGNRKLLCRILLEGGTPNALSLQAEGYLTPDEARDEKLLRLRFSVGKFADVRGAALALTQSLRAGTGLFEVLLAESWLQGELLFPLFNQMLAMKDKPLGLFVRELQKSYSKLSFKDQWEAGNQLSWLGEQAKRLKSYIDTLEAELTQQGGSGASYAPRGLLWPKRLNAPLG